LQHEPALQAELQTLRETVLLLHDMPTVSPPRSFTLDPAHIPARRSSLSGWLGSLQQSGLASLQGAGVVAVLVLALGIGGVLAINAAGMGQQAASLPPEYEELPAQESEAAAPRPTGPALPAMGAADEEMAEDEAAEAEDADVAPDSGLMTGAAPTPAGTPPPAAAAMQAVPTGPALPEADSSKDNAAAADMPPAAPAPGEAAPQQQAVPSVLADSHDTSSPDTRELPQNQPAERSTSGTASIGLVLAGVVLGVLVLGLALWFWRYRNS
jgi:hypothetical protein